MFHLSNSHIDIARQKAQELQQEAQTQRLLQPFRPNLRLKLAQTLHNLAHKLEPSITPKNPVLAQEC